MTHEDTDKAVVLDPLPRKWPKGLTLLTDVIEEAFIRQGRRNDEAREIAEIAVKAMAFLAGGRSYYLPKGHWFRTALKHGRIFREFTGDNVTELADKYELTEVQIYTILAQQRKLREGLDLSSLPGELD